MVHSSLGGQRQRRQSTGPRKGNDRFMQMRIDFMEAVFDKTEEVTIEVDEQCSECMGSGARSKDDTMKKHIEWNINSGKIVLEIYGKI